MTRTKAIPELSKLIEHARNIVFEARRQGTLDSLSVNGVKKQLELHWSLDEGTLNTGQYKKTIGDAVRSATTDEIPGTDNITSETKIKKVKEQKVDRQPYEDKPTSSTSLQKKTPDVPVPPLAPVAESSRSASAVVKKVAKMPKPEDRGRRDFALNTTKAIVKLNEPPIAKSNPITILKKPFRSREYIEDDEDDDSAITDSSGKGDRPSSERTSSESEELERSRRRGKRRSIEEVSQSPRKRSKGDNDSKSSEGDEATIKRLKGYVGACGVRKKWAKEFENCPQPSQQIRRLKKILADLGMEGKYSKEKAKQIKKERALKRELEDVIDFERKAGVSRTRRRKSGRPVGELDTETESDDDNDESDSDGERHQPASAVIKKYLKRQRIGDSDEE